MLETMKKSLSIINSDAKSRSPMTTL